MLNKNKKKLQRINLRMALGLSAVLLLTSCDIASYIQEGPLPEARVQAQTGPDLASPFSGAALARYQGGYGGFFGANQLEALILEAQANNPDYLVLRHKANREYLRIADTRRSNDASLSTTLSTLENRGALTSSAYTLSLDLDPGIDLWGQVAATIRSGELGSQATLFDLVATERALQKSIVRAWADLLSARITMQHKEARLGAYNAILDTTRSEVRSGKREAIDLQLAEIDTISATDQLVSQRATLKAAEIALNRLLGRPVDQHIRLSASALPRFAGSPPARLPSELITRRPDIQAAWARLIASDENVRAARLAMLPSFRLTGSAGNTTTDFAKLLDPALFVRTLLASFTASLFSNGANERQVELAKASIEIELQNYASTVMDAMTEVYSLLNTERSLKRQIALQKQSVSLAQDAFTQELAAMRDGNATLYDVSSAALRLYNSQDQIILLRTNILKTRLDLYVALGDDFFAGETP